MDLFTKIVMETTLLELYLLIGFPAWVVLCNGLLSILRMLKFLSGSVENAFTPLLKWLNIVAAVVSLASLLTLVGKAAPFFVVLILILLAGVVAVYGGVVAHRQTRVS